MGCGTRSTPGDDGLLDRSGAYSSTLTLRHDDSELTTVEEFPPAAMPVLGTVTITVFETDAGRNEVRIDSTGTLNEDLVDTAIAELQRVRAELPR